MFDAPTCPRCNALLVDHPQKAGWLRWLSAEAMFWTLFIICSTVALSSVARDAIIVVGIFVVAVLAFGSVGITVARFECKSCHSTFSYRELWKIKK
jgi:hypothetical protein